MESKYFTERNVVNEEEKTLLCHVRPITLVIGAIARPFRCQNHPLTIIRPHSGVSQSVPGFGCFLFRCQHFLQHCKAGAPPIQVSIAALNGPPPLQMDLIRTFPTANFSNISGTRCFSCWPADICRGNIWLDCAQINVHVLISGSLTSNRWAAHCQHITAKSNKDVGQYCLQCGNIEAVSETSSQAPRCTS